MQPEGSTCIRVVFRSGGVAPGWSTENMTSPESEGKDHVTSPWIVEWDNIPKQTMKHTETHLPLSRGDYLSASSYSHGLSNKQSSQSPMANSDQLQDNTGFQHWWAHSSLHTVCALIFARFIIRGFLLLQIFHAYKFTDAGHCSMRIHWCLNFLWTKLSQMAANLQKLWTLILQKLKRIWSNMLATHARGSELHITLSAPHQLAADKRTLDALCVSGMQVVYKEWHKWLIL